MTGVFEAIKRNVDILDVAARYGVNVDRHGKALCFVHSEKTPSLSFKGDHYHCFGCGASGDAVDMVAAIAGIPGIEAAKQLDAVYSLHLFDEQLNAAEVRRRAQKSQADRDRLEAFKAWEQKACNTWAQYCRILRSWQRNLAPTSPEDEPDLRYIEALHKLDWADYVYETVFIDNCRNMEVQVKFYQDYKQEVERIEQNIGKHCFTG